MLGKPVAVASTEIDNHHNPQQILHDIALKLAATLPPVVIESDG